MQQGYVLAERYQLLDIIGSGGMAMVYRGREAGLNREVAIKVMASHLATNPEHAQRFTREAQTIAALQHPNIIQIHYYGVDAIGSFVVMPLLKGGTLSERMRQSTQLIAVREVGDLAMQVGSALHHAHQQGVIHRDIKFSNIMFDTGGNPYVMDFGIARLLGTTQLTSTGGMVGTPHFMPPEQWRGEITAAVDQYALAVVLYELISGKRPYDGNTPHELMYQHLEVTPKPIMIYREDVPLAVDEVLQRALSKDAQDRFPTMLTFARAMQEACREAPEDSTGFFTYNLQLPAPQPIQPTPHTPLREAEVIPTPEPVVAKQPPSFILPLLLIGVILLIGIGAFLYNQQAGVSVQLTEAFLTSQAQFNATSTAERQTLVAAQGVATVTRILPTESVTALPATTITDTPAATDTHTATATNTASPTATITPTYTVTSTSTATQPPTVTRIPITPTTIPNITTVNQNGARVYDRASYFANTLVTLDRGQAVTVVAYQTFGTNTWYQVRLADGREGFMISTQLDNIPNNLPTVVPPPTATLQPTPDNITTVNQNGARVYDRASYFANTLVTLDRGQPITVVAFQTFGTNTWYQVRIADGREGFMISTQLDNIPNSLPTVVAPPTATHHPASSELETGRVSISGSRIYERASYFSSIIQTLQVGDVVYLLHRVIYGDNIWYRVQLADGREGYIISTQLEDISGSVPVVTNNPAIVNPPPTQRTNPAIVTNSPATPAIDRGRITQNGTRLQAQASTASAILASIAEGTTIELLGRIVSGETIWYHVRLNDGREGYITASRIDSLDGLVPIIGRTAVPVSASSSCEVRANGTVAIHVGPSSTRNVRGSMPSGWVSVTGQARDENNNRTLWWRIFPEGSLTAEEDRYWVLQSQVITRGNCEAVLFVNE